MVYAMILAATIVGCDGEEQAEGGGPPGGGGFSMPVEVAIARLDTVVEEIVATGQVEAVQSIDLRPEVSGRLVEILVREGREVPRGTPLFKVDDAELIAQVDRLEAERDLAQQALARTRELIAQNASSTADLEIAEANARSSQAQLDLQQTRLERTVVRAPFSGVVGERLVSVGDYLTSATVLTSLQTIDPQRASFQVPERFAARLAIGQTVTFRVAAVPDRDFVGTVDFVDPVVSLPGRTIKVKAVVGNGERLLKQGMFVEARLAADVRPDATVIPEDAVLPLQGADFVWVVTEEGVATRVEVELGVRTPGYVEILSGVEPGTQVVVAGGAKLGEGMPVTPIPTER